MMDRLTVVVASWSGANREYLQETVESIKEQGIEPIVLMDDRVAGHKWDEAIETCTTEYLSLPHHDDVYLPGFFEAEVAYLDSHPECAAVFTMDYLIDGTGKRIGHNELPFPEQDSYDFAFIFAQMLERGNFLRCPSVMFRASMVKGMRYLTEECRTAGDTAMWFQVLAKHPIGIINKQLYKYRQQADSDTQKNVIGGLQLYDHYAALDYAAGLKPGLVPWAWPFVKAQKNKEREDKREENRLRELVKGACGFKFIVCHEPPDNAGTGILCADRCRRNNSGNDGEVSIFCLPNEQTYRVIERDEFPIHNGVVVLPLHPKRLGDAIAKHKPASVEIHHTLRWPADIVQYATHLHLHDSYLWCSTWHQVDSENKPCPGPTDERCLACVVPERAQETKDRLEIVRKHLPKRVYACSPWLAEHATRELGMPVKAYKWDIPPIPKFHAKKKVGYFGTFHPVKGIDVLMIAATKMPDVQFLLFTDPPDAMQWMFEGRKIIGYPNIVFMGRYLRSDLGVLANLVDVVVVPSRCESFGLVSREAAELGKKVVATNTGGMVGTVRPGDANDLIRALREAL